MGRAPGAERGDSGNGWRYPWLRRLDEHDDTGPANRRHAASPRQKRVERTEVDLATDVHSTAMTQRLPRNCADDVRAGGRLSQPSASKRCDESSADVGLSAGSARAGDRAAAFANASDASSRGQSPTSGRRQSSLAPMTPSQRANPTGPSGRLHPAVRQRSGPSFVIGWRSWQGVV